MIEAITNPSNSRKDVSSGIFLPLDSIVTHNKSLSNSIEAIKRQYALLEQSKQDRIENVFSRFLYDPGVITSTTISNEHFMSLKKLDSKIERATKLGVKILNKRSVLTIAEKAVLDKKKIAFVKFDINYLRLVDKAGYADVLLRELATIMNQVAKDHKEDNVIAARTGGDTFCFFLSSKNNISQEILEKLHKEVEIKFSRKKAFYKIDEQKNKIIKNHARIKKEPGQKILANGQAMSKKILRTIVSGRMPDERDLMAKEVDNNEFANLKKKVQKKLPLDDSIKTPDKINNKYRIFSKKHPELEVQNEQVRKLIDQQRYELADYLLSIMDNYFIDPLLDEEVFAAPDLIRFLQARQPKGGEKIVLSYFPWLKNMNSDLSETIVDNLIREIYKSMDGEVNGDRQFKLPRARKDGGDFIYLSEKYINKSLDIVYDEETLSAISGKDIPKIFKKSVPVFITTIDYPTGGNIGEILENIKLVTKTNFIQWLSDLINSDQESGGAVLDYYLKERAEDRARELLLSIQPMDGISKRLDEMLKIKLKTVEGENKQKILKDLGVTRG